MREREREIGTAEAGAEYPMLVIFALSLLSLLSFTSSSSLSLSLGPGVCIEPPLAIGIRADELMHLPQLSDASSNGGVWPRVRNCNDQIPWLIGSGSRFHSCTCRYRAAGSGMTDEIMIPCVIRDD